ncbi:Hypothetical predicted protein, partial [Paramuricea clavata]
MIPKREFVEFWSVIFVFPECNLQFKCYKKACCFLGLSNVEQKKRINDVTQISTIAEIFNAIPAAKKQCSEVPKLIMLYYTVPLPSSSSTSKLKTQAGLVTPPTTTLKKHYYSTIIAPSTPKKTDSRSTTSTTQPTGMITKNKDNSTPKRTDASTTQPQLKNKSTQREIDVTTTKAITKSNVPKMTVAPTTQRT